MKPSFSIKFFKIYFHSKHFFILQCLILFELSYSQNVKISFLVGATWLSQGAEGTLGEGESIWKAKTVWDGKGSLQKGRLRRRQRKKSWFGAPVVTRGRWLRFLLYCHLFLVSQQSEGADNHYWMHLSICRDKSSFNLRVFALTLGFILRW